MRYAIGYGFDQPDRLIHDIDTDLIDGFIVDRLMQVIPHCCPIDICVHTNIYQEITASDLFVGIITMMGKKGHAFEFDFSHFAGVSK